MIYKLIPTTKDYIWGGTRLAEHFGKTSQGENIAESWELSCHEDGHSLIAESGQTLAQHLQANPKAAGTLCPLPPHFPMLVKFIDAKQDLSVQVHPDDNYARKYEGQAGKTEMWYVVDCTDDAYLYYGFVRDITNEEFAQAIQRGSLCDLLNKVKVKKGDVFFIEAGTIHAIGAGCLIAEVQQSSNVTYRVFDYGRRDAQGNTRELHIEKALKVTHLKKAPPLPDFAPHLVTCDYFTVDLLRVETLKGGVEIQVDGQSFRHIMVLDGTADITCDSKTIQATKGDSIFAQAYSGAVSFKGDAEILVSYLQR